MATADSHSPSRPEPAAGPVARGVLAAAFAALAAGLGWTVLSLPADGPGLAPVVAGRLAESGVENPVTAVLLNFRGYDTLLEAGVLLLALIGVWSLTPAGCWGGVPGPPVRAEGPDPVPHAMVITGIVVAVSATAFALVLAWRIRHATGRTALAEDDGGGAAGRAADRDEG